MKATCKDCSNAKARRFFAANPEKHKEYSHKAYWKNPEKKRAEKREYNKRNPLVAKRSRLKYNFGITLEDYASMVSSQGNACQICLRSVETLKRELSVDHCHTTGKVRGLLCTTCNFLLGYVKEDTNFLNRFINYLNEHNKKETK